MKALSWLAPTKTSALDGSDVTELILYRLVVLHPMIYLFSKKQYSCSLTTCN